MDELHFAADGVQTRRPQRQVELVGLELLSSYSTLSKSWSNHGSSMKSYTVFNTRVGLDTNASYSITVITGVCSPKKPSRAGADVAAHASESRQAR